MEKGSQRRRLRLPSPAMSVACLSLAIALSGASYAAVVLPRNSVGTPQLKANAVKSAKVAPNTLNGSDIREGTLGQVPSAATADRLDGLDSLDFLRSTGKAADADLLDGSDSAAFLRTGAIAGGDLTGTYPNPSVAADAIRSAEILNGSLNAGDTFAASGSVSEDPPSVPANSCVIDRVTIAAMDVGDVGWLFPSLNLSLTGGLTMHTSRQINDADLRYTLCNVTNAAIDAPSGNWGYLVVDF